MRRILGKNIKSPEKRAKDNNYLSVILNQIKLPASLGSSFQLLQDKAELPTQLFFYHTNNFEIIRNVSVCCFVINK